MLNLPSLRTDHRGNKRTAFAATYTFLGINGVRLTAEAQETYDFVAELYEKNQFNFEQLVPWLRAHVAPETPRRTPRTKK